MCVDFERLGKGSERTFPATEDGLRDVQVYLEQFVSDPKPAIVVDEIVSNIVRCSKARRFTTRLTPASGGLEMAFVDDGVAFDPTSEIPEPDLTASAEDRRIGGLGMFMVKKMARAVSYRRTADGRNELTVLL